MAKPKLYQVDQLETTLNASYSQANTASGSAGTANLGAGGGGGGGSGIVILKLNA